MYIDAIENEPIIIPVRTVNREQKRIYATESLKSAEKLMNIESNFVSDIMMIEQSESGYDEVYNYYLQAWNYWVNYLCRKNKYCKINEHYFTNTYKPCTV